MEQKQLDDLEETYFGEEFIDDEEEVRVESLNKKKMPISGPIPSSKPAAFSANSTKKSAVKSVGAKSDAKISATLPRDEEGYVVLEDRKTDMKEKERSEAKMDMKSHVAPQDKVHENKNDATKPKKVVETSTPSAVWGEKQRPQSGSSPSSSSNVWWKILAGVLLILLVVSIMTSGFRGLGSSTQGTALSQAQAEQKVLDYVNTNLLQAPYVAQVDGSADLGSVYKVTLSVADQSIDSYITKDGTFFFPQGFDTSKKTPSTTDTPAALVDVDITNQPFEGSTDAPVTIVEFSDFECPFCGKFFSETYSQLKSQYIDTGKVKLVFRDFPLSFHPEAQGAALAVNCAHEQGKFWQYHDLLFKNQDKLATDQYYAWAAALSLDAGKFKTCFDTKKYLAEIQKDQADGEKYGVSGTPAFFINGKLLSGAQPFTAFQLEIEAALVGGDEMVATADTSGNVDPAVVNQVEPQDVDGDVQTEPIAPTQPNVDTTPQEVFLSSKKWSFSPTVIDVKVGIPVKLTIKPNNQDPTFSLPSYTFSIPTFGVEEQVDGTTVLTFTPDHKGDFPFTCSSCPDQRNMKGTITVK